MNKTVLIVEDDKSLLNVLSDKLSSEGLKVLQSGNGQEGLAMASKEHPDLVILDLLLPELSGLDMLARLRKDSWGKSVPVFVLTNLSATANISKSVELLASGYFIKSDWSLESIADQVMSELRAADMKRSKQ